MDQEAKCPLSGHATAQQLRGTSGYWYECPACGRFGITRQAQRVLSTTNSPYATRRYVLASLARARWQREESLEITTQNIQTLLDSTIAPRDPFDLVDNLLLFAASKARSFSDRIQLDYELEWPAITARGSDEFGSSVSWAGAAGLISDRWPDGSFELSPEGWRRVNELRQTAVDSTQAFVAMWFDKSMDACYRDGLKPALEAVGYQPIRIDREHFNNKIDDEIIARIRQSGLLVADMTGHRQGVYFEAGFAAGLGIDVIYTCRADHIEKAHFDTRQYNHITWQDPADLKAQLINRIEATLPNRPGGSRR